MPKMATIHHQPDLGCEDVTKDAEKNEKKTDDFNAEQSQEHPEDVRCECGLRKQSELKPPLDGMI